MALGDIKEKFKKFIDSSSPLKMRMMAADGLIPGTFTEQVALCLLLLKDPHDEVRKKAINRLRGIPADEWKKHFASMPDDVLDLLVRSKVLPSDLVEDLILKGKLSNFGIKWAVKFYSHSVSVLEAVSRRQDDLLADREIADIILASPKAPESVKSYLRELLNLPEEKKGEETTFLPTSSAEEVEVLKETEIETNIVEEVKVPEREAQSGIGATREEDLKMASHLGEAVQSEKGKSRREKEPLSKMLLKMSLPDKIRLAEVGGEDARSILIKDSNKLVALAVLRNPRLREDEIATIAASRSVIPDVLERIAHNKKWMKNYSVKLALVNNPKTPVHVSLRILPSLFEKDLKNLKKNRNIPTVILNQAKKILQQKEAKR